MADHTPGPWTPDVDDAETDYAGRAVRTIVRDGDTDHPQGAFAVCVVNRSRGSESFANADLIAAAPDLLAALHQCRSHAISGIGGLDAGAVAEAWSDFEAILAHATTTIAKAEKET